MVLIKGEWNGHRDSFWFHNRLEPISEIASVVFNHSLGDGAPFFDALF